MLTVKLLVLSIAKSSYSVLSVFSIINYTHPCYWAHVSTRRRGAMCTLPDLVQPTMLKRSATKIMQLNMKCGNKKYGEK